MPARRFGLGELKMSSTTVSTFVAVGLLAALCGCSSESQPPPSYVPPTGGSTGSGGTTTTPQGGSGGGSGGTTQPQGGTNPTGGAAGTGNTGGTAGGSAGAAGTAGTGGSGPGDVTAVRPTAGCTLAPPGDLQQGDFTERHMEVSGTKDADSTDSNINGP